MEKEKKVSIVLACMDYRFWPKALSLLGKKYGKFDLIELAGGSKNLASPSQEADRQAVLESIKTSVNLHGAKKIILTNHIDCGAYGGSGRFASAKEEINFHQAELKKAAKIITKSFPSLTIEKVIISHDKTDKINLINI
jgi:carbonic anhydrase